MTDNLTDTIRKQYTTMRHLYAGAIATKLRAGGVADGMHYDEKHTITAWRGDPGACNVRVSVAAQGVDVMFFSPGSDIPSLVTIAAPYMIDAVVKVVEGLLLAIRPTPAPSTVDTTICCGRPVPASALAPWRSHGDTVHEGMVHEGMVYHCPRCNEDTLVDVVEVTEPHIPATTAGGDWR